MNFSRDKIIRIVLLTPLIFVCFLMVNRPIMAYDPSAGILQDVTPECRANGTCQICDFVAVFSGIARLILGLTGGIALLLFIVGGFYMVASQGNEKLVSQGREIVKTTVIGIVIVLGAWQMTRIFIAVLVTPTKDAKASTATKILDVFKNPTKNPCN